MTAREFAIQKHSEQRYNVHPYVYHLDATAAVLREFGFNAAYLQDAAYLHDVREDTETTDAEIQAVFGAHVAELVEAVTDEPGKNRRERKAATYPKIAGWVDATVLKLADRIANVREAKKNSDPRLEMWRKEHDDFVFALFPASTEALMMWEELEHLLTAGVERIAGDERVSE